MRKAGTPTSLVLGCGCRAKRDQSCVPDNLLRLNSDYTPEPRLVIAKTRPTPLLRPRHQPSSHRIPVNISELLNPLLIAEHIEVVIPVLPKGPRQALYRHRKLEGLYCLRQRHSPWLANQQMNMFRHHHISSDKKLIAGPYRLQRPLEHRSSVRCSQIGASLVTGESQKVQIAALVIPHQIPGHNRMLKRREKHSEANTEDHHNHGH